MTSPLVALGRKALFRLEPEVAHSLSIKALRNHLVPALPKVVDKRLNVEFAGLKFPNPVGLAAGYDKNAEVPDALLKLGFGAAEVGTLTPRPQPGNPRPRIFRLVEDEAVINRLGFNNGGHQAALERLKRRSRRAGIVGVNIGANKDSEDRVADYVAGIRTFANVADYFTVNISSPNTPGLRNLQAREQLAALLAAVMAARESSRNVSGKRVPVFLKIAPDLGDEELDDIAAEVQAHGLDGVIVSNTTLARPPLVNREQSFETGGLSGKPLFERSTIVLARMRRKLGPDMPLIGVGGVDSAESALVKIMAGADLVQLYTGFVYQGPGIARRIVKDLIAILDRDQVESIRDYRDRETEAWAERPLG